MSSAGPAPARGPRCTCPSCSSGSPSCSPPPAPPTAPSSSTRPSAWPATRWRCSTPTPGCAWSAWTATPTPAPRPPAGSRPPAHADRATLVPAVFDELPDVLDRLGHRRGPGRAVRPRRLLAAAGPPRARLQLLRRRPAGHADGPHRARAPPPTSSTPTPPRELARVLRVYGEERFASRIAAAIDRERAREPLTTHRAAGRAGPRRHPGRHPPHRRPPGQADVPGAAHRGQRRARRARAGAARRHRRARASAAGSSSSPSTPSRTGSSSRRSPPAPPTGRRRRCPFPLPEHGPVLRLLTRGGEAATDAETAANPRAASARVRAAERIRRAA